MQMNYEMAMRTDQGDRTLKAFAAQLRGLTGGSWYRGGVSENGGCLPRMAEGTAGHRCVQSVGGGS